jgi:glycosyltransferase involved in cell wall biosynthesis
MKISTLLVLPSIRDTFGMVLVEAGACERPVIAYDVGGPKEIIVDGENGFLVKPRDIKDLARKIGMILSNKKLAEAMGRIGRQIVERKFTWDKIVSEIESIYLLSMPNNTKV